jgi:general secretion pathway protein I
VHRVSAEARRNCGFTLIEVVISLAIFAVTVGLCMQIATSAMRQSRIAAERTQAALVAQSLLDIAGVGERLRPGRDGGEIEGGYRWELEVSPYDPQLDTASPLTTGLLAVQLYRLDLELSWEVGRERRSARFSTLRAMTPDPNVATGIGGGAP